jgi:hypothetical protein
MSQKTNKKVIFLAILLIFNFFKIQNSHYSPRKTVSQKRLMVPISQRSTQQPKQKNKKNIVRSKVKSQQKITPKPKVKAQPRIISQQTVQETIYKDKQQASGGQNSKQTKSIASACKELFLAALVSSICLREGTNGAILYAIYNEMMEDEDLLKLLNRYNQTFQYEVSILQKIMEFKEVLDNYQVLEPTDKFVNNLNELKQLATIYKNYSKKIELLSKPTFEYLPFQENLIQKDKNGFTTIVVSLKPQIGKFNIPVSVELEQITQEEYFKNKLELLFCGYNKEDIDEEENEEEERQLPPNVFIVSTHANFLNFLLTQNKYKEITKKFLNKFLKKFPDCDGQTDVEYLEKIIKSGTFVYLKNREFMRKAAGLIAASIQNELQGYEHKKPFNEQDLKDLKYKLSVITQLSVFAEQKEIDMKKEEEASKLSTVLKVGGGILGAVAGIYLANKKNILTPEKIGVGAASIRDSLLSWYNHSTVREKIKSIAFFPVDQVFDHATSGISLSQGSRLGSMFSKYAGPAKMALYMGSFVGATAFLPSIFGLMLNPAGFIMRRIPFLSKYGSIFDLLFDTTIKKIFDKKIKILYRTPDNLEMIVVGNTLFMATLQLINANKPGLVGAIVKNMVLPTILKSII